MDKARVLRAMFAFAFAFAALFSCSESGGGNSKTPAEEKAENAVGKTNDGHDVVVFNPGDLDEVLFKIDTVYITDSSFSGRMFFRNLPASKTPEPGDIINSTIAKNAPSGFLYRVADVTKEGEDVTIVSVGYASIAEAVKEAEIEFTIPLVYDENGGRPIYIVAQGEGDEQAMQFLAKGGKCGWNPFCGLAQAANWVANEIKPVTDAIDGFVRFVVTGDGQFDTQTSGGIVINKEVQILENELGPFKAKGSVGLDGSYTVWLTMKMKIEDYRFEHFKVAAGHTKDFKLKGELEGKVSKNWEKTLFEGYLGSVVVPVGGIKVTLDNHAIVKVKLEAEATAKMEAGITFKQTDEYGVEYIRGQGWKPINNHDKKSDYYYKHSIYGQVRFGIIAGLKTTVNGFGIDLLAGPSLVVKNDMLSGDLKKGLWSDPKITLDADVDFEMNIRLGFLEQIAKEFKDGCNLAWLRIPQGNLMKNEVMPGISFTADTKTSFNSESKTPSNLDLKEIDKGKLSFKFTTKKSGALGFSVKEVGFCVEPKEGECVKGPGRGKGELAKVTANAGSYEGYDIGSGYNDYFTANFEGLAPGTYNIVPYFKALDDEIYYDTEGALKNFVISNYCGEGGRGAYDPETQFCSGTSVYNKCEGKTYDPETKFCSGDVLYDKCGGRSYVPAGEFCSGNAIYFKCEDKAYDPETKVCYNLKIYDRCGDSHVDPATHFCSGNALYRLCGGKTYDPPTQFCSSNVVYDLCGGNTYNSSRFCFGDVIYMKCGYDADRIYDPSTQFCSGYSVYDLCGGNSYNPSTQFCSSNAIYNKCGNSSYDPATQFCSTQGIYDLCGGNSYDPDAKFCFGNALYNNDCGTAYNPSTQFCSSQGVLNKCGGNSYDPSIKFCLDNTLYEKCGSESYNPSTQFCFDKNKRPYSKCDGKSYDPSEGEFCCGTKIFDIKTQYCSLTTGTEERFLVDRTEGLLTDPRDGQAYITTVIGTQTWLAENLNYNASGSKCYNDNPIDCKIYGKLYDWSMAMALPSNCNSSNCSSQINNPHQGICPSGWHIPSKDEWEVLIDYAKNDKTTGDEGAGRKLKAAIDWNTFGWTASGPVGGGGSFGPGTDKYGFSALAGGHYTYFNPYEGYYGSEGYFDRVRYGAPLWTISEYTVTNQAYFVEIDYGHAYQTSSKSKGEFIGVRCLKD